MTARTKPVGRRTVGLALALLFAMVLVPFLFWRGTWFGRPLTEAELERYLHDDEKPRHIQHALVQISEQIEKRAPGVDRWRPRIAEIARHPVVELRVTAAWVMGHDNQSELFHRTLLGMLDDADPIVRRNAALALARFGDVAARPHLVAMLRPATVSTPQAGVLKYRLKLNDTVNPGTLIARVETGKAEPYEVRSPLPGKFLDKIAGDDARVANGQEILMLGPSPDHVWEALRALYLVGKVEDLADVERFTKPPADWPDKIGEQAKLTARQIRSRAGS